jgi:hypothetical protein
MSIVVPTGLIRDGVIESRVVFERQGDALVQHEAHEPAR